MCQFDSEATFTTGCKPDMTMVHDTPFVTGPHQLQVTGTDVAGNHATIVRHVIVDATPPGISFVTPPTPVEGSTVGPSPTWEFTVAPAEPGSTVYTCHFDSEPNIASALCVPNTPIIHVPGLTDGPHHLTVIATDIFLNATTIIRDVIVDATPPTIVFDYTNGATPANGSTVTSPTENYEFTLTSVEPPTPHFDCSVDGSTYALCSVATEIPGTYTPGLHTISVTATDIYGNTSSPITSRTFHRGDRAAERHRGLHLRAVLDASSARQRG